MKKKRELGGGGGGKVLILSDASESGYFAFRHPLLLMCQPEIYWLLKQRVRLFHGCQISNNFGYRKIPKISPGAYIFQRSFSGGLIMGGAYFRRGLYSGGNDPPKLHKPTCVIVKRCSCIVFSLKAGRKDLANRPKVLSPSFHITQVGLRSLGRFWHTWKFNAKWHLRDCCPEPFNY